MSKLSCIIIEDEPLAAKVLTRYIAQLPFLELKGTFRDAILATEHLRQNRVDLIFLDIHLPKLKGMAFLKTLSQQPAVIITTAYHQYAVEGFEQNVTDYLLKPFDFDRFVLAVNKVRAGKTTTHPETIQVKGHIFVTIQKKKVKISFDEILFIESQREYIRIVTTKNEYKSKMGTNEIEELLPSSNFRRIHRSFIVAINKIDAYTTEMVEIKGNTLPVGRLYRDAIGEL